MKVVNSVLDSTNKSVSFFELKNDYLDSQKGQRWKFLQIKNNLLQKLREMHPSIEQDFVQSIIENFEKLIVSEPIKLEKIISDYEIKNYNQLLYRNNKQSDFGKSI